MTRYWQRWRSRSNILLIALWNKNYRTQDMYWGDQVEKMFCWFWKASLRERNQEADQEECGSTMYYRSWTRPNIKKLKVCQKTGRHGERWHTNLLTKKMATDKNMTLHILYHKTNGGTLHKVSRVLNVCHTLYRHSLNRGAAFSDYLNKLHTADLFAQKLNHKILLKYHVRKIILWHTYA